MIGRREPGRTLIGLVLLLSACNSDRPEPAVVDLPMAGIHMNITRTATHPCLARYRLTLQVEGPQGCSSTTELFPDTGYAGRRNVYQQGSGSIIVLGQYDARAIETQSCSVRLVEFQSLGAPSTFLGSFDVDREKRWRYLPAAERAERPFEKH